MPVVWWIRKMEYNSDVFCEQFPIVKRFLYHLVCYRELFRAYLDLQLKSEFWTHTIDAHLLQAAILWCMVFDSDGCNPTHWKKLSAHDSEALKESFRQGLFNKTELTQESWQMYWEKINRFRGGYAAHRELNYSEPVPDFNIAQDVAYFYDQWIREVIEPDIFDELPLKESLRRMQEEIKPLAMHYLAEAGLLKSNTKQAGGEGLA
jgi:hypothetical protein